MALLSSEFSFTGSLGNLSAYKMRGVDGIILRTKGGASRKKIKTAPEFDLTRRVNAEFGGRATATKWIMRTCLSHKPLADYNIAGPLNALLKPIQNLDTTSELGKRSVALSKNPKLLEGFSFNRQASFDSMLRAHVGCVISRTDLTARVEVPALIPGINFHVPPYHVLYSITASLGVVPDLFYTESGYAPAADYDNVTKQLAVSEWHLTRNGSAAQSLELKLNAAPPDNAFTLVVCVGIRFGVMYGSSDVQQVKYAGAAKILAVG